MKVKIELKGKFRELLSPPGNNFYIEVGQDQGHGMVQNERACHKDHACQISMLYHSSEDISQVKVFVTAKQTDGQTNELL